MGTGLLLAAMIAIGPMAAGDDFYGENPITLLNDPKVAPLLDLSADQKGRLQQDLEEFRRLTGERTKLHGTRMLAARESAKKAGSSVGEKVREANKTVDPAEAEIDARIEGLKQAAAERLTPKQYQRLRELSWQLLGIEAVTLKRHQETLEMTDEEIAATRPLALEAVAKFRELSVKFRSPEPARTAAFKDLGIAEQEIVARIVAQLEPSTKAKYEALAGEPGGVSRWELQTKLGIESEGPRTAPKR